MHVHTPPTSPLPGPLTSVPDNGTLCPGWCNQLLLWGWTCHACACFLCVSACCNWANKCSLQTSGIFLEVLYYFCDTEVFAVILNKNLYLRKKKKTYGKRVLWAAFPVPRF